MSSSSPSFSIPSSLSLISAPMVNQSDLPFRLLVRSHGASLAYTQMLLPHRLLNDPDYLAFHQRDLACTDPLARPVVVQLAGNDPETLVRAARTIQGSCDAIDLNLGCPQESAKEGHFGAYLLGQKDWPLVEQIVSALSHSLPIPVSTKLRLAQPASQTPLLADRLAHSGASWITLHARHVSARRRRAGAADLSQVRALVDYERVGVPVVSNGNVRTWEDVVRNRGETGADGVMVGETLLGNPYLFENTLPDPVDVTLEYLALCHAHPGTASIETVRTHVRHFVEFQCARKQWYPAFRAALGRCMTLEDVERVARGRLARCRGWKGVHSGSGGDEDEGTEEETDGKEKERYLGALDILK